MKGTVIFFSNAKGWGFLKPENGGPDLFVHHTSINQDGYRSLKAEDQVSYEEEVGPKGKPQAANVTVIR